VQPWLLCLASCALQAALEAFRALRVWHPLGTAVLLAHAAVLGLVWGLMSHSFLGRLLFQLVAIVFLASLVAAAAAAAPGSWLLGPRPWRHQRALQLGLLLGAALDVAAAPRLGVPAGSVAMAVANSFFVVTCSFAGRHKVFLRSDPDDCLLVTVAVGGALFSVVHAQLLLRVAWFLTVLVVRPLLVAKLLNAKVVYYLVINMIGTLLIYRCVLAEGKQRLGEGGPEFHQRAPQRRQAG